MEAGEAVYQGREGTGLAQILNWQQAKTPQYNPLIKQREERQQRESDLKRLNKDLELGLGSTHFNPFLVQKADAIRQKGKGIFANSNSYGEAQAGISDDISNFNRDAKLSLAATEELKRNKEAIYSGKDKFIRPGIADQYNFDFYHPQSRDVNDVNWESGRNLLSHPGIDDPEGRIVAHAKALKEGISSEDIDVRNKIMGNNGQYVQKTGDSYHFKSNPDGTVHNDVIKGYLMQENGRGSKNADGILWQTIAEDNGLDQMHDRNKIDEIYLNTKNKIKEAPESEFSQKVQKKIMDKVRSIVEPLNYHKHTESLVSIGRNPSARSAGSGSGSFDARSAVSVGEGRLKNYKDILSDRQIGYDTVAFQYPTTKEISFDPSGAYTQAGSKFKGNPVGKFSGMDVNPSTGKKEMVFKVKKPYTSPQETEDIFVPLEGNTAAFQGVVSGLDAKKRPELLELKKIYDDEHSKIKPNQIDDDLLADHASKLQKFYTTNKKIIGTPKFDEELAKLTESMGLSSEVKGQKTGMFEDNLLYISKDKINPSGDIEDIKAKLYDSHKRRYKKSVSQSEKTTEKGASSGKTKIPGF